MFNRTVELTRPRPLPILARLLNYMTPRYQPLPPREWTQLQKRLVAVAVMNTGVKSALR